MNGKQLREMGIELQARMERYDRAGFRLPLLSDLADALVDGKVPPAADLGQALSQEGRTLFRVDRGLWDLVLEDLQEDEL